MNPESFVSSLLFSFTFLLRPFCRHEYLMESDELEQWIKDNMQAAASEDYGQDYEHLQVRRLIAVSSFVYM